MEGCYVDYIGIHISLECMAVLIREVGKQVQAATVEKCVSWQFYMPAGEYLFDEEVADSIDKVRFFLLLSHTFY